ncbi:MAG: hypothetical protein Kow0069_31640 [Promethearchaeota archaeon]
MSTREAPKKKRTLKSDAVDRPAPEKPPVPGPRDVEQLSPLEREVLDIAKGILKLKRYEAELCIDREETATPMVEKLFAACVAKLTGAKGYARSEIFLALRELERKRWIVTGQRRTREEVLSNPKMRAVLRLVSEVPGVHARDPVIEQVLGITRNPFTKQVATLRRFGLVASRKFGRSLAYFPRDFPEDLMELCAYLSNELARNVVRELLANPGAGVTHVAAKLGVFHGAVQYHVKALKRLGLLDGDGRVNEALLGRYNAVTGRRKVTPSGS